MKHLLWLALPSLVASSFFSCSPEDGKHTDRIVPDSIISRLDSTKYTISIESVIDDELFDLFEF